jgi:hypothetical protein
MSRLAQLGVFTLVLGLIVVFLGMFPGAVEADTIPGVGLVQILAVLAGLVLLILGGYVVAHATLHRGHKRTLLQDIAIRMGLTGLAFSVAATMADAMGFGSHVGSEGPLFGFLQAAGLLAGFGFAALGVFLYGVARS